MKTKSSFVKRHRETIMKGVFAFTACMSILAVILICVFLFANGLPAIGEIGVGEFLGGTTWRPLQEKFGILPMIVASLYVTAGAIIVGVPIGILCAVFLARFCPARLYKVIKPATNLMAGIPSIVYGFFGLVVIVPVMQDMRAYADEMELCTAKKYCPFPTYGDILFSV